MNSFNGFLCHYDHLPPLDPLLDLEPDPELVPELDLDGVELPELAGAEYEFLPELAGGE
jgi:hypothetical protein